MKRSRAAGLAIGVVAMQGDVREHLEAFHRAMAKRGIRGNAFEVRSPGDLETVDGLAIPGGESTTISRLIDKAGLRDPIVRRATEEDLPILGTCAGLILLASEGDRQVSDTRTRLLNLMEMAVDRNAFGRQRESFEADVELDGVGAVRAVFIRSPAITRTWGRCAPAASLGKTLVAARQGNRLALAFHPELTSDTRVQERFLETCRSWKAAHSDRE